MPKEIVQFADTARERPTSVELVWSKPEAGGNLQLHFQQHDFSGFDRTAAHNDYDPAEQPGPNSDEFDLYTEQLSRDDCNRLIRALRRARDAVYGADA